MLNMPTPIPLFLNILSFFAWNSDSIPIQGSFVLQHFCRNPVLDLGIFSRGEKSEGHKLRNSSI